MSGDEVEVESQRLAVRRTSSRRLRMVTFTQPLSTRRHLVDWAIPLPQTGNVMTGAVVYRLPTAARQDT